MRFLGWVLLIPHAAVGPEIEIGWRLCRDAWGYGYASEAAGAVVEHAFRGVGLEKIVADIHPGNAASMKVAEKIGMKFVGVGEHGDGPCESYAMGFEDFLRGSER
jgi:RimJ/RimL family protein N-acetyltransferase